MVDEDDITEQRSGDEAKISEVTYYPEKDFYRGLRGELRYKAEGLFKKAKEKGISIEEIFITTLKENQIEFPGMGVVELPTFIVKVKGKHLPSEQVIVDAKQIDYYNRYLKYTAERIERKNAVTDEKGRIIKEGGKPKIKPEPELVLTDWERFDIGKSLVEDKEFGLEKTITGACDRVIRKLMGENDWLYPDEARLLDEEFNDVQGKIAIEQEKKQATPVNYKKATERQINYFKSKVKNMGLNPDDSAVIREVLKQSGINADIEEVSTHDMSKAIDSITEIAPKVKEVMSRQRTPGFGHIPLNQQGEVLKQ